ncbi:SexiOBP14 [Operophtera brumata]|uniref:SexiOBP14 n=1 Tax=Operophtera brumata TaxID=104452 RepID=A0A0L7KZC7_OPEBR|nr:SexiOBP14 [Operophtera brumata]
MECNKQHPISPEEMMMMKDHKMPDSENAKCLMACVMRKATFIDDKGNFSVENAIAWAGKEFQDEPKRLESSKSIYDICKKVNDEPVSDGEKGCDRAFLLSKCLIENAPKVTLLSRYPYNT